MRTGERTNFFAIEDRHHMDTYVDGDHVWRFLGSSQAIKFDFQCAKCGRIVKLDNVVALALCVNCKDVCKAADMAKGDENTFVYLALCNETKHHEGNCVSEEEVQALTEYFNCRIKTPGKKILFVPCSMRGSIDFCQAETIADADLRELD
jgi:hypothetical protein